MKVTEIFYSLQGESSYIGIPCTFIRLSGCNLDCEWCDTDYAKEEECELTIPEIIDEIQNYPTQLVCITGGEPLLQEDTRRLCRQIVALNYKCLLETNGSLSIKEIPLEVIRVMDIKTPSSKMDNQNLWSNIDYLQSHDEVKFVIADKMDYFFAKEAINKHKLHLKCNVLMSPETRLKPTTLADWVIKDKLHVRFQIQLHKHLWGNVRGK
ncbi:radical SAM protein [bacterium]|nr:radical SAM protein [bacterium]